MRIRGQRRCVECGEQWSYYETGDVSCPACGSIQSRGVEEDRRLHTDAPVDLDLTEARGALSERPLDEIAAAVEKRCRQYVAARGFVDAGELRELDGSLLAAAELRAAASILRRSLDHSDDEEAYFLSLLADAPDGERPEQVPPSLRAARGLAVASVLETYRQDVSQWLEENPDDAAGSVLASLREQIRRVDALDGEIDPVEAARLVSAARDLGTYLREGDETALARADERLVEAR